MMPEKGVRDHIEVKVGLAVEDLIAALKRMDREEREHLIENLLAASSPEYLESIEEARRDWRQGRVNPSGSDL